MSDHWIDIPEQPCPTCGYIADQASTLEGLHRPLPGDFSLCLKCGEVMVFNQDMTKRIAELNDLMELCQDTLKQMERIQKTIRAERFIK